MSKPLEPHLPRWGHVSVSASAITGNLLHGNPGFDSADEALRSICAFLVEAGQKEAHEATVTIRPPGLPRGEPADRMAVVNSCDTSFEVTDDLKSRIRMEIGSGSEAPSLKLVFRFDKTTQEG